MAGKYVVAVSDALIRHETIEEARKYAEQFHPERPMVIVEVRAVAPVHPVKGLTNEDVPPPTGGTPVALRMAA